MTFAQQQVQHWTRICQEKPRNEFYRFIRDGWISLMKEQNLAEFGRKR